jgi:hypothetical protein
MVLNSSEMTKALNSRLIAARNEATRGLADLSKDVIPGSERRELAIEVRDAHNCLLLRAALWFEVAVLAGS